jgi:hypothetical protein
MSQRALEFAGSCEQGDEPAGSVTDMSNSVTVSFIELNMKVVLAFYYLFHHG